MFTVPTVLVLGAGASVPYGYPTGDELIDIIIEHTKILGLTPNNVLLVY